MTDKARKVIENCILKYLFKNEFKFNANASLELYQYLNEKINSKNEYDLNYSEFEIVFNELVNINILIIRSGKIEKLSISAIEYAIDRNIIKLKDLISDIYTTKQSMIDVNEALIVGYENIPELTKDIEKKIESHEEKINKFDKDILTIMSLLLGAFSIIGFNIQGIGDIIKNAKCFKIWEYIGSIVIYNVCIMMSLYFLFF